MDFRRRLTAGLSAGTLALLALGCEVEDDPAEELIPDNDVEDGASS